MARGRPHGVTNADVLASLRDDVKAVLAHRESVVGDDVERWYADVNARYRAAVDEERDFVYTSQGVSVLRNRYLYEGEPIQRAMLRFASTLTRVDLSGEYDEFTEILYHALSCGMLHVSSILAAAPEASRHIVPGEACRLMVVRDGYDRAVVEQIEEISRLISLGVGVGVCANSIPRHGKTERNKIRSGFRAYARRMNACNYVTLHERRPKIAMYVHVHCETVYEMLDLKVPSKQPLENVFFGLMIPNHFMDKLRRDEDWHLFDGTQRRDGRSLDDFYGDEYAREYELWVAEGRFSRTVKARSLMNAVLLSIVESGSPYVVWSDHVNVYNNQRHRGPVKTLNLCAEIANHATSDDSSSCVLMSCNVGLFGEFPDVQERICRFLRERRGFYDDASDFGPLHVEFARFAQSLGYVAAMALNAFMGRERRRREIGLSLLGVYDAALTQHRESDPYEVCAVAAEALYKGAAQASCDEYAINGLECANYDGSEFSRGRPQWYLRNARPRSDWSNVCLNMSLGMANSMLTCQAPTATTCLLTGVCESVLFPMAALTAKESENGRDRCIAHGVATRSMRSARLYDDIPRSEDDQLRMYVASLPYVDHSQSTMFCLPLDSQRVFDLLVKTYKARLKTGLYYALFRQANATLTIARRAPNAKKDNADVERRDGVVECDACTL